MEVDWDSWQPQIRANLLFVVRAGSYDLLAHGPARSAWHPAIDVPLDRTRLWVTP